MHFHGLVTSKIIVCTPTISQYLSVIWTSYARFRSCVKWGSDLSSHSLMIVSEHLLSRYQAASGLSCNMLELTKVVLSRNRSKLFRLTFHQTSRYYYYYYIIIIIIIAMIIIISNSFFIHQIITGQCFEKDHTQMIHKVLQEVTRSKCY